MTENQSKALKGKAVRLDIFLKMIRNDSHIKNKDIVEEIRLNINSEIDRLLSLEGEEIMEKYTENSKPKREILKLKNMLEKAGIRFKFEHSFDGYHICYPKAGEERVCSVIEHCGSYGHDKDLLEIMGLLTEEEAAEDDVAGWLTAEDVFSRIKKHWEDMKK